MLRVAYVGNFEPEHSTERHVLKALQHNGIQVTPYQENNYGLWKQLPYDVGNFDFVLWTKTGWNPPVPPADQYALLEAARSHGVPVVGYHLDRWWGLNRENDVRTLPFFKADLVITADGGHEEEFRSAGVNHHWMPPGVSLTECLREPLVRPDLRHEVVFCGSWFEYHNEWSYRLELCNWLQRTYGDRVAMYPKRGHHALRGQDLVDLYYNSKVMVGDSCLNGKIQNYWSDRVPETLGRGGFLIHPGVEGLQNHFTSGKHLVTYTMGDWDQLKGLIDYYVEHDAEREDIAAAGKEHVLATATYEVRMKQVVELLQERGMIK